MTDVQSSPQYAVVRPVAGNRVRVDIAEQEFLAVVEAHDGLMALLEIEEAWDIVLGNYRDYERAITDVLVAEMTGGPRFNTMESDRINVARMLSNLLSSVRAFQDMSSKAISSLKGKDALAAYAALTKLLFDATFSYRLMEKLRNHSQHHGLAVTSLTFRHSVVDRERIEGGMVSYRFHPQLAVSELRQLPKWKKIVQEWDELQRTQEVQSAIDLTPHVRSYMYDQSRLMARFRETFTDERVTWHNAIQIQLLHFLQLDTMSSNSGIVAAKFVDGDRVQSVFLGGELDKTIAEFEKVNGLLVGLPRAELRS